jgi:hypothetical protein
VAYVDLSKAFDRVNHAALWATLLHRGVHPDLLARIKSLYTDATARVRVGDAYSAPFNLDTGVKQGCPLSPLLFNIYIDTVVRSLIAQLPNAGIQIGYMVDGSLQTPDSRTADYATTILALLLYADDIVLMALDIDALRNMLVLLDQICTDLALEINYDKTVHQTLGHPFAHTDAPAPISIPSTTGTPHLVHPTDKFKYLGSILSTPTPPLGTLDGEISRRISSAWYAFNRLTPRLWKSNDIQPSTKIQLYNAFVISSLLYSCQGWTLNVSHIHRLEVTHNRFLRSIKRIPHNLSPSAPHTSTSEMHAKDPPTAPIINSINKHRMLFIGSLARHLPASTPLFLPRPQPQPSPNTSVFPPTAALFMSRRPDAQMPDRVGAITSYRLNAHEMFTSAQFTSVVKALYEDAIKAHAEDPASTPPELAAILEARRLPPKWTILARFPRLWNSICLGVAKAGSAPQQ